MPRTTHKSFEFSRRALSGLRPRVPADPFPADLGDGPAYTVHILPSVVSPEEVVFAAKDYPMDNEGYWISVERLRDEDDWYVHLSGKVTEDGHRSAVVLLAEALAAKATY